MGYPAFQRARAHKFARRTAGDVTVASNAYAAIDTTLDITLEAQAGDTLEFSVSSLWDAGATNPTTLWSALDVATIVSSAVVNYCSGAGSTGLGILGWFVSPGSLVPSTGVHQYTVVAGDIADGRVTVRLLAKNSLVENRVARAAATQPLQFTAKNLGPQDPN